MGTLGDKLDEVNKVESALSAFLPHPFIPGSLSPSLSPPFLLSSVFVCLYISIT